jgi:hypothetical protein
MPGISDIAAPPLSAAFFSEIPRRARHHPDHVYADLPATLRTGSPWVGRSNATNPRDPLHHLSENIYAEGKSYAIRRRLLSVFSEPWPRRAWAGCTGKPCRQSTARRPRH